MAEKWQAGVTAAGSVGADVSPFCGTVVVFREGEQGFSSSEGSTVIRHRGEVCGSDLDTLSL